MLSLISDTNLTILPHIMNLKTRHLKVLDILRVRSSSERGGYRDVLLALYQIWQECIHWTTRQGTSLGTACGSCCLPHLNSSDAIRWSQWTTIKQQEHQAGHGICGKNNKLHIVHLWETTLFHVWGQAAFYSVTEALNDTSSRGCKHGLGFFGKVPEHPQWLLKKPSVCLPLTELRKLGTHPPEYQRLPAESQGQFEDHLMIPQSKSL